ncbi:MAG: ABC transporter substrate-binding protein, partial [Desulfatitalea sp.]|nr:ABC transporter substrate-binding protein [Desulfatitalea sp.]NNJ99975.1 ABC transporter substrate-binding protein [Desulfatitalea sp.]
MFKFRLKSIGMPTGLVLILAWAWMAQGCFQKGPADTVRVGLPDEPRTLNPWLASDVNSRSILRLIYQPLYQRDPETLALVPWLAAQLPVYDAGRRTYTIRLRSARWSDGRPLTAADVAFSGRLIKAFNLPGASHWRCVEHIETPDDHTVVFYLKQPYAAFINRTLQVSILPAHCWQPIADEARKMEKPLAWLLRRENRSPVGSGPFVLKQWHRGAYLYLERNPRFFGSGAIIAGRPLGPHIQGILIKFFGTTDVAMLALRKGTIDVYQQHIQPGYLEMLEQTPHVQVMVSEKSALYYMGFNTRRQPFNDVHLRRAVALLINKDFIVERLLQRQGTQMWS